MIEQILNWLTEMETFHKRDWDNYQLEHDWGAMCAYKRAKEKVQEVAKEYAAVVKENLTSEKNGGWIPCSERLPEEIAKDCLVTLENGAVFQAQYAKYCKEFRIVAPYHGIIRFHEDNPVIAWCELPAPYQKGE